MVSRWCPRYSVLRTYTSSKRYVLMYCVLYLCSVVNAEDNVFLSDVMQNRSQTPTF